MRDRNDLSEWVIHFVHDRDLSSYPENISQPLPFCFDEAGKPLVHNLDKIEHDYLTATENYLGYEDGLSSDASAYEVLKKILSDGYIKSSWSFRDGKRTIYGPRSAVCFTEMPLYALVEYASERNESSSVDTYGIALRRQEFFNIGGRPVIYGLSGNHQEVREKGFRCLSPSCGIGLHEQYRYVSMKLDLDRKIDWTHEREWRWAVDENLEVPGLPIWLKSKYERFSSILLIVKEAREAEELINIIKTSYDGGGVNYSEFDQLALTNTVVVSLEEMEQHSIDISSVRLEDLPIKKFLVISPKRPSAEILAKVENAVKEAREAARNAAEKDREIAPRDTHGYIADWCGFAVVVTYRANTEITNALLALEYASPCSDRLQGYFVEEVTLDIETEQTLRVAEAAAKAAAEKLSELLNQEFSVQSWVD